MANLGKMYYHGKGVKRDSEKAIEYYQMVSEKGDVNAIHKIKMPCHNVDYFWKNYQLRCALAIVTSLDGTASHDG